MFSRRSLVILCCNQSVETNLESMAFVRIDGKFAIHGFEFVVRNITYTPGHRVGPPSFHSFVSHVKRLNLRHWVHVQAFEKMRRTLGCCS